MTHRNVPTSTRQRPLGRVTSSILQAAVAALCIAAPAAAAKLYTVGSNQYGQIGNGLSGAPNNATTPYAVPGFESGVTAVGVGGAHVVAAKGVDTYGWGLDFYGQLGLGSTGTLSYPSPQLALLTGSGLTQFSGGQYHTAAIVGGGLYTYGANLNGVLANGTASNAASGVPGVVTGLESNVTQTAAGARHMLAVHNGGVFAWGYSEYGQIGQGASGAGTPSVTTPYAIPTLSSGVTLVAAGSNHSLALKGNTVYGWGNNQQGAVGSNGPTGGVVEALINTPQAVVGLPSGTVQDIAAGGNHSLALVNNAVYAWGQNNVGQLGQGAATFDPQATAIAVPGITGVIVDVEAGGTSSYALDDDGSIWAWGSNSAGQLGLGTTTPTYEAPQHLAAPAGFTYTGIKAGSTSSTVVFLANLVGDFNRDDAVDALDIDSLFAAPQGTPAPGFGRYDVTSDHSVKSTTNVTGSDADRWVRVIKQTEYGDANLDGRVDFDDLLALAQNYGAMSGGWAMGNFDGLAGIGFDDLLALSQNYGFGTGNLVLAADFDADWALAQTLVPEPTTVGVLLAGGVVLRRRRDAGRA